jgi:uncharacterized phage protein (TIGR02218 family)
MRSIPAALQTHLTGEVISLAKLIKITRTDNVVVRLTSHDRDLVVGGDTYQSDIGFTISALQSTDTLSVDNAELEMGLDETVLTADDFRYGLYDRAAFEYSLVNWEDTTDGVIAMKRGEFGDITLQDDVSVKVQLRGLTQALQRSVVEKYSPTCRVNLGGLKCGVVNTPLRIRRNRQKVKTWDWYLVPNANITTHAGTNFGFETDGVVANGSSGISDWTYGSGSFWKVENDFTAGAGTLYLEGGDDGAGASTGTEFSLYQTITTATLGMANGDVDDGDFTLDLSALIAATSNSVENPGRVSIEQFDTNGVSLKLEYSEYITPEYQTWEGIGIAVFIVPGCRSVRIGLHARKNNGASATVAFDVVGLRYWTNVLGSYGSRVFRTVRIPNLGTSDTIRTANDSFESGIVANGTSGIAGWTYGAGSYWQTVASANAGAVLPHDGVVMLQGGDNGTTTNDQVYQLSQTYSWELLTEAQNVTDGWYFFRMTAWYAKLDADSDARMTVEFLDVDDNVVATLDTGYDTAGSIEEWRQFDLSARVPTLAVAAKYTLWARSGTGSAANVVFDEVLGYFMVTAHEQTADASYGRLADSEPTYDYDTQDYTIDGEAIAQCRPLVFDFAAVTGVTDNRTFAASSISQTAALMYSGKITWLSGNNAGRVSFVRIWDNTTKVARLYGELQHTIQVGDKFVFAIGCDKTIGRCADTFGNAHNFRGEPYLPGPSRVIEFLTTQQ